MAYPTGLKDTLRRQLTSDKPLADVQMSCNDAFEYSQDFHRKHFDIMEQAEDLGLQVEEIYHNSSAAVLYEQALKHEVGSSITGTGALSVTSGQKTGRSPKDKRIVDEPDSVNDIWWGKVNIKLDTTSFDINRERAVDYLNTQKRLYVVDGFAGWDEDYRIPIRVITSRAYHALFMQNMLVAPTASELCAFDAHASQKPFVIFNAGCFPCNRHTQGMSSSTSVALSLCRSEMVILGTQYAGEMKKGVFTVMMYHMPLRPARHLSAAERALPLHSSCNVGPKGDVSLFFGLSGTGKTTLSADPHRELIGDDEHVWTSKGVFNIEGGCYAKCINLSQEKEPEIFQAIRFGSVLENVVFDKWSRKVDYDNVSITENTRCAYPLHYIPNARIPAKVDSHPRNVILLTCDAFGVLPPISKLTKEQVMYHFISGYTAKVAGTEMGVTEPQATFSACFGGPFLAMHPFAYAEMLAAKLEKHGGHAWLLNTGWVGGKYGVGERCPLKYTRQLVDAIHDGTLAAMSDDQWEAMPSFGLLMPRCGIKSVPKEILRPEEAWFARGLPAGEYWQSANHLAELFCQNFQEYADRCTAAVLEAGPKAAGTLTQRKVIEEVSQAVKAA
jgi:phosphoenolpyruvate carboxykinase (ATP)